MPAPDDHHRATNATANPFENPLVRINKFTAQEIATLQSRLDKQLGPEYISSRPGNGGGKVHYLAAEKVINLANEVFGFNGWSSQIQNVQIDFCDESQTSGKITLGLSIIVRVTLKDGTYHEDIGYGHIENCKGKAAAFEKAKKEAATDALKRALRNFGNVLGNCLYDKDYLARVTKLKVAPSRWDAENLHRHPEFGPARRGQTHDVEPGEKPASLPDAHSMNSLGAEFEDEFGVNLFDGVELAENHADEIILPHIPSREVSDNGAQHTTRSNAPQECAPTSHMPPPRRSMSGSVQQQPNVSIESLQAMRKHTPAIPSAASDVDTFDAGKPNLPSLVSNCQISRPPSPQKNDQSSSVSAQPPPNRLPANQHSTPPNQILPPLPSYIVDQADTQLPLESKGHEPPVGFITSRAAEMIHKQAPLPANVRFNPKAESPSIPRTAGVNHATSAPISRDNLKTGSAVVTPVALGAVVNRSGASNFINPSDNVSRRIGMPGGGTVSPHNSNRTAYKPPTIAGGKRLYSDVAGPGGGVVRPPLVDVSNTAATGHVVELQGRDDMKKAKMGEA